MEKTNIKVYFRIMGDEYDTQIITDTLKIYPTQTWAKGDYIRQSERQRTYTAWIYIFDAVETLDIGTPVKKIEEMFFPKTDELCQLKEKYKLDISIDFVINIENQEAPAIYFEERFIKFAAKIGAVFDLDTYIC